MRSSFFAGVSLVAAVLFLAACKTGGDSFDPQDGLSSFNKDSLARPSEFRAAREKSLRDTLSH